MTSHDKAPAAECKHPRAVEVMIGHGIGVPLTATVVKRCPDCGTEFSETTSVWGRGEAEEPGDSDRGE